MRLDYKGTQGPLCKMVRISGFHGFVFQWKIWWTGQRDSGPWWTMPAQTRGSSGALPVCGAQVLGLIGGGEGGRAGQGSAEDVLIGARAVAEKRRDGGEEWRWLELSARELRRDGKRGGEGRGCSSPFLGPKEHRGGWSGW
jgi:hypothetical protein